MNTLLCFSHKICLTYRATINSFPCLIYISFIQTLILFAGFNLPSFLESLPSFLESLRDSYIQLFWAKKSTYSSSFTRRALCLISSSLFSFCHVELQKKSFHDGDNQWLSLVCDRFSYWSKNGNLNPFFFSLYNEVLYRRWKWFNKV